MVPTTTIKGNPVQGLAGATLGFFIGFAAVSLFGPTVTYLQHAADLTPFLAGLLISIPNLSGSLLRIPFSAMVDTTGGRRPFVILLVLSIIGVLGIFLILSLGTDSIRSLYPLLLFFGILGGCGIATFSVGISQTSYWFPRQQQGSALGTYAGIGNLAPGIFAWLLSAVTLPLLGLPGSYLAWTGFLIIGLGAYLLLGRNAWFFQLREQGLSREEAATIARERYGQQLFPGRSVRESLRVSAGVWRTWGLTAVYFTTFGGFMALTGWLPKYWSSFHEIGPAAAGALTAVYSILASLTRVAGGRVSDRFGGENTAAAALTVTMAGAAVVALSAGVAPALAGIIIMALGMGVGNAAVFKIVPQAVPDAVGGAAGWVGGLGAFGGFTIPLLLAAFAGSGEPRNPGYAHGFAVFIVLGIVSLIIVGLLRRAVRSGPPDNR